MDRTRTRSIEDAPYRPDLAAWMRSRFLILPFVGGYFVVREGTFIKYRAAREDGHRLYFRIVYYGAWLFGWAFLLLYGLRVVL